MVPVLLAMADSDSSSTDQKVPRSFSVKVKQPAKSQDAVGIWLSGVPPGCRFLWE